MENEKRMIDANELEAHFHETKMIEIFPYWKELSFDTQSELVRFGKEIKKMIQNAPTVDAVEVVRCKDCKWRQQDEVNRNFCGLGDFYCGDTDFCSRGERKDNAD